MNNISLLKQMVKEGYVSKRKHPTENLFIYNYTAKTQYDQFWNEITLQTRGLILDKNYNVVSRPFQKFFNIEETKIFPETNFDVFEKMDGSLGIGYWVKDKFFIATRGSFISEQAEFANNLLNSRYKGIENKLKKDRTYLFEIIYPENKIVVDYGKTKDIFLLAIIDNKTGRDLPFENIGTPIVKHYPFSGSLWDLKDINEENKEGFVVRFENGLRVKIKFNEYVRLHRIVTGISNKVIWEYLKDGKNFNEMLDRVPDEFYNWVKETKQDLEKKYQKIISQYVLYFKAFKFQNRKDFALHAMKYKYPFLLFALLDGKDISEMVWKIIKPTYQKPFYGEDEI